MISPLLHVMLLVGLLIVPATAFTARGAPGDIPPSHHQPGDCGPGPDC